MFMSARLDRVVVGSILKQRIEMVFLISVRSVRERKFVAGHRPLHNLVDGIRRGLRRLTDEGWALIMRAIKCRKGIWWMPWR